MNNGSNVKNPANKGQFSNLKESLDKTLVEKIETLVKQNSDQE